MPLAWYTIAKVQSNTSTQPWPPPSLTEEATAQWDFLLWKEKALPVETRGVIMWRVGEDRGPLWTPSGSTLHSCLTIPTWRHGNTLMAACQPINPSTARGWAVAMTTVIKPAWQAEMVHIYTVLYHTEHWHLGDVSYSPQKLLPKVTWMHYTTCDLHVQHTLQKVHVGRV